MNLPASTLTLLLTVAFAVALMLYERTRPNVDYPSDWHWMGRAAGFGIAGVLLTMLLGAWIESHASVFSFLRRENSLTRLPDWIQGFAGYLCVTFIVYWWHRFRHQSDRLWTLFHQIHHSTYRLEVATAFYAHPTDFLATTVIVSAVAYGLLGYGLDAAAWTAFWVGIFELWEHTNIRTPRWLGYIIVRPEMHRVHHEKDHHRNNYGLPVWDMLFGTYENSMRSVVCGFTREQEEHVLPMLLFKHADRQARP